MKKIDIIIPVVEKDLDVLPHVIDSARKNIKHPLGEILIVAPLNTKIEKLSIMKNCRFIDENSVLPIRKKDINYKPKRGSTYIDRSGWLFQQLLKLSGNVLSNQEGFLVLDADTMLIQPHVFKQDEKTVFHIISKKCHQPYFDTYERLLGEKALGPPFRVSFITHYMFFQKKILAELKNAIEAKHHTDWYTAVINSIDKNYWVSFSEYETYGNFMLRGYPDKMAWHKWGNLSLKRSSLRSLSELKVPDLAKKYRSLSFHSYND